MTTRVVRSFLPVLRENPYAHARPRLPLLYATLRNLMKTMIAALISALRGEDRIAEELGAKFGMHYSGSTIRRYMIVRRRPRAKRTGHPHQQP